MSVQGRKGASPGCQEHEPGLSLRLALSYAAFFVRSSGSVWHASHLRFAD